MLLLHNLDVFPQQRLLICLLRLQRLASVCLSLPGFYALCISVGLVLLLLRLGAPLGRLFELLLPLAVSAVVLSFLFSIFLYARSFSVSSSALAPGGNTGEMEADECNTEFHPQVFYCLDDFFFPHG